MSQNSDDTRNLACILEESQDCQFEETEWRKTSFRVQASPQNLTVTSWSLPDRKYQRFDLPIYAYPLLMGKDEFNDDQIIVRGYNKFFHADEISLISWKRIEDNTRGPYEISVVSKFPCNPPNDSTSPEEAGERWLEKQLAKLGKRKEELAKQLRSRNVTLVADLCDDSFEERVISYTGRKAGLYLHGININVPRFETYSSAQVQKFAKEWGFLAQKSVVIDGIKATRNIIDNASKTGTFNGRVVKGVVVRCKMLWGKSSEYEVFFFKCKLEGPYQIYRQWREYTKAMIKSQFFPRNNDIMTHEYLEFAQKKLLQNPELGKAYLNNHGVIRFREEFVRKNNISDFSILKRSLIVRKLSLKDVVDNIILVPISTIGCGKTTVSLSLSFLFGWGCVRNNTIEGRNRPYKFAEKVLEELTKKPVVFADRSNVQKFHRNQLILHFSTKRPQARMIALNFMKNEASFKDIRKVAQDRILPRIENHQRSDTGLQKDRAVDIINSVIKRFEKIDISD
ncbi:t-RNA ligase [Blumeria hordei DH14]|uniref:T-RNA ligase n=1 Tax=Blumeria graminis f. sp. hordei (strain DH14) TaxID=546991 RepID=N1J6D7_BLUG1|nr:t-RNA ligase [Blumeria hordei DH14]